MSGENHADNEKPLSSGKSDTDRDRNQSPSLHLAEDSTMQSQSTNSQQQVKWVCEYCTYENYPLSLKCTMCKGQKPLLHENIYRISPTQQLSTTNRFPPSITTPAEPLAMENEENLKWFCTDCSYRNIFQNKRCVRCNCVRREEDTQFTMSSSSNKHKTNQQTSPPRVISDYETLSEKLNALNVSRSSSSSSNGEAAVAIAAAADSSSELYTKNSEEQRKKRNNSPTCGEQTRATTSAKEDASSVGAKHQSPVSISPVSTCTRSSAAAAATGAAGKWFCPVCTYENWPKSLKCSMCLHSRDMKRESVSTKYSPEHDENVASNIVFNNKRNQQQLTQQQQQHMQQQESINNMDVYKQERYMRQLRRQPDWQWLNACIGIAENNVGAVETYLSCGGDPSRALTAAEVTLLNNADISFDVGHTLIHLAIRFHRDEMLPLLLAEISGSGPGIKRVPSYVAPDLASGIRRHFAQSLRIRKASFNCQYVNEHATFSLPADIDELPLALQEQLYEELLDRDAQKELELPPPALNWSLEITERLGSRLMVLWNRSAGDCLLDSAMQATWGVFDRDNTLRRALADSLHQCGRFFYPRWKENEIIQAALLHYTHTESQLEEDWSTLLSLASHPGSSLEQLHIFVLAHILRRPIIVYGVKYVKSFKGEALGYARFEGVYLPLLWEHSFCISSPIALGYTRGHFSALVPTEPYSRIDAARDDREDITFLPLMNCEMKLLPIHFLSSNEIGREETIMRQWMEVCDTEGGLLVAQQKLHKRPLLVAQLLEEWLNHYRRIAISRLF